MSIKARVLDKFVISAKAGIQIFFSCSTMYAHFRGHDSSLFNLSHCQIQTIHPGVAAEDISLGVVSMRSNYLSPYT
jgi:hypothetical protein